VRIILSNLKEEDPKTYLIISIAFIMMLLVAVGFLLYLTAITKYEGFHIGFAIAGGILIFLIMIWLIGIMKDVSKLKTAVDWEERRKKIAENKKLEIVLEKMKSKESLDPDELQLVKDLEADILQQKQGEQS